MNTTELQKAILGRIMENRPEPSDFHTLYYELGEPGNWAAFGRSVSSCLKHGWLEQVIHPSPPHGDGQVTRELRVTADGEKAFASGDLSPQSNRDEWKVVRGPFIGSSDLAAVLGMDAYRGPWDVWDRIVLGKWDDQTPGGDIRRGVKNEANALERFGEVYGVEWMPEGMIHHPDHHILVSDVDGVILGEQEWPESVTHNPLWEVVLEMNARGLRGALEVKCPRVSLFYQYKEEGMPLGYAIQMQHHLCVTGLEWGVFVMYTAEYDDVHAFPVVKHPAFQQQITQVVPGWYEEYVVGRKRPDRPEPAPPEWPPQPKGEGVVVEDAELREMFELVKLRRFEMDDAVEQYAETEKALLAKLKGNEEQLLISDGVKVTRYSTTPRRQFDRKKLRAKIATLQEAGDTEALLALDPDSDEFYYLTDAKTKEDVKVFARPEQEG